MDYRPEMSHTRQLLVVQLPLRSRCRYLTPSQMMARAVEQGRISPRVIYLCPVTNVVKMPVYSSIEPCLEMDRQFLLEAAHTLLPHVQLVFRVHRRLTDDEFRPRCVPAGGFVVLYYFVPIGWREDPESGRWQLS